MTKPIPAPTTTDAQRQAVLARLHCGPMTTLQARQELDIMHPAARVMELRGLGFNIITHRAWEESDAGQEHRVARYVLLAEQGGRHAA